MRRPAPADIPHHAVQESHEADAREKKAGQDQPLLGRAEGVDGFCTGHRRRERLQVGKGGYFGTDGRPPPKVEAPTTPDFESGCGSGQVPRWFHHLRQGGVQVPGVDPRCRHTLGYQADDPSRTQFEENGQSVAVNGSRT